jgi:hypothetical protein
MVELGSLLELEDGGEGSEDAEVGRVSREAFKLFEDKLQLGLDLSGVLLGIAVVHRMFVGVNQGAGQPRGVVQVGGSLEEF